MLVESTGNYGKPILTEEQAKAVEILRNAQINSELGLPEELFLLTSALVPLPNVDLLVLDKQKRILLTRRNDDFFEKSWHIPGRTMRYGESFEHAIRCASRTELGTDVDYDEEPLAIRNVIRGLNQELEYPRERGHNVAILYRCYLPDTYEIDNRNLTEYDEGFIKWFQELPEDFMKIQYVYKDILKDWIKG